MALGNLTGEPLWTPEPIVAFRGWAWNGKFLDGPHTSWETAKIKASHLPDKKHASPHAGCNCGVNGYKNPLNAREHPILGMIHLTGEVHEYETGYRGEMAEIVDIQVYYRYRSSLSAEEITDRMDSDGPWPVEEMDREIAKRYGVPVSRVMKIGWRKENGGDW